ncbi:MAG: hypothetical protein JWM41_4392 [Gemmatimonadetes bacterium]|nr:hypothetical protein [Gemmatimonadota bacterium]
MTSRLRVALLAAGALACGSCGGETTAPSGVPTNDLRQAFSHGTCKGSGIVRYAASPMAIADVGQFIPLGVMTGGHVTPIDHQYLLPLDLFAGRTRYNVVAPFTGNIVLIQPRVKAAGDVGTAPVGSVDYRIVFEGSCTYWVYYDLVTQLEPSILAAGGSALAANNSAYVRIPVTAGQLIGKVGGQTLDLGTVNADITLPGLLVPEHYVAEPWKIHSMDALDYFDEPLRGQLNALNRRKALPRGGKIDFDVDGAAVGNWFLVGTNGYGGTGPGGGTYWTGHLSLAYGNIDPALVMISMAFPDGSSRQWVVEGNTPDPAAITVSSGVVKYEVKNWSGDSVRTSVSLPIAGVFAVQVLAGRQLRAEFFPGLRASTVAGFDAAARTYER